MSSSTNLKVKWESEVLQDEGLITAYPVVGGIYRDAWDRSFAVVSIAGNKALLEYADGGIASVKLGNWHRLRPMSAAF